MRLDLKTIAARMRTAETEQLMDRVTVFREEMEPAAVDLIEGELARRGVTDEQLVHHLRVRIERAVLRDDGTVVRCNFCERPAVVQARGWFRIFRFVPLYPRLFSYCVVHERKPKTPLGIPTEDAYE
ncbi:hypothetical protein [Limnoglobus roseus]|uniref:Uncharacterized protein n=1 Tax=Limnoglobus roseus TaxID=2598579 RepID=A0A5C1AEW4_9BACT|nr:hypothetical protein [Limnoglobus roseus]QEL16496.1 hypothetical protein PX52LOC_03453 [Limnoglobus roseus]